MSVAGAVALAALGGAAVATVGTTVEVAGGGRTLVRATRPAVRSVVGTIAALTLSAGLEELLFRVGLLALLMRWVPAAAVVLGAVAFAGPHAVRGGGDGRAGRWASVVNAFAFAVVLGALWLRTRSLPAIVAFHLSFDVVAGVVLGGAALLLVTRR